MESIRTPNSDLKYKNSFDHKDIYSKLPPPEKDFVYQRAVQQKEQLEAASNLRQKRLTQSGRREIAQPEIENHEKATSLRDGIKSDLIDLVQNNPVISHNELIDKTTFSRTD